MTRKKETRLLLAAALAAALALVAALGGCAPQTASETGSGDAPASNDTAAKGEYTPYDPAVEAEHVSGKAIEGSEEEELQQERIAGGAVGAVTSQNLEPLEGIVNGSEGDYVAAYGINGQPPAQGHGDNGADCLSCHKPGGAGAQQPPSHLKSNLASEDCATCHQPAA